MFVSYAQNFEDVLLWRAVGHVEHGFYIDVGAQEPDVFSVSRSFYEHGWRGVHIEPVSHYARKLRAARPDEVVIEAAIAEREGTIEFYEIAGTGLSTGRSDIAGRHSEAGFPATRTEVPSLRLGTLLDRYADRQIHWLKIDVEEMEAEVIASWSPSAVRPWVVVVESTAPLSQEPTFAEWEPLLLEMDYRFAHFDGLNRFYVHAAHPELVDKLKLGPNVFDGFVIGDGSPYAQIFEARLEEARQHLVSARNTGAAERAAALKFSSQLEVTSAALIRLKSEREREQVEYAQERAAYSGELASLRSELARLASLRTTDAGILEEAQRFVAFYQEQFENMHRSMSWRLTAPLRRSKRLLFELLGRLKKPLRKVLEGGLAWVRKRPAVARALRGLLRLVPPAERFLLRFAQATPRTGQGDRRWAFEPEPQVLAEWRRLLRSGWKAR